jgi:ferredoxin-NADP reductase
MDEEETDRDRYWHISRGIPVAPMLAMLGYVATQVAFGAWFASSMNTRVEAIERAQIQAAPQGERLTRVEEKLVAVQSGIMDIKSLLQVTGKPQR